MTTFGFLRPIAGHSAADQVAVLRAHSVLDKNVHEEWTTLLARLAPGDTVIITRPHVLAATGRQLVARCEEVLERGAHLTPVVAGIPERILVRGGTSKWLARQTGR